MSWQNARPDLTYAPVELRRNGEGKLPPDPPCPELDRLEHSLGNLTVTACTVLASCGVFQSDARLSVVLDEFETEVEGLEVRARSLLLHSNLTLRQRERLENVKKTMAQLWVVARACCHLGDVPRYAYTVEERCWMSTYLTPAVSAAVELGMRLAEAVNKNDPAIARDCVAFIKRLDEAIASGMTPAQALPTTTSRHLMRAALLALMVIRDSFGTVAALRVFA